MWLPPDRLDYKPVLLFREARPSHPMQIYVFCNVARSPTDSGRIRHTEVPLWRNMEYATNAKMRTILLPRKTAGRYPG
jgi:hypothetical protein